MTITDFILARVAEDERMAGEGVDGGRCTCRPNPRSLIARADFHHPQCPLRVLAECEAKRMIVALWDDWDGDIYDGWTQAASHVLTNLAAVWSDHPDYDARWRT